jgi:hypothetical protein
MFNISKFLKEGMKNTILFKNNSGISHKGPWIASYPNTLLDRFHVGDFSSVEYTISADFSSERKEILKALVTASVDTASVVVYARNSTLDELINIDVNVNNSYVDVKISPAVGEDSTISYAGAKVIFTANYFHTQNSSTS